MSDDRPSAENRDPDYAQFEPVHPQNDGKQTENTADTKQESAEQPPVGRIAAIRRIIEREFQKELTAKEQELEEVDKRLDEAKKLLARVRYAVVYHYYNQKHLLGTEEDVASVYKMRQEEMYSYPPPGDKPQMAIHPSLKKLLGKRPIDYNEILKQRPTRRAAQNATEQFHKLKKKPAKTRIRMAEMDDEIIENVENRKPRYVEPSTSNKPIEQINSARGRNIYRHLLVVGNISKYIGDEEADSASSVTHKWLVYVSTKTSVSINQIVSRARFFLHESYKPNEVVDISSPPFQITKRGWGEFPVRVQLYFHEHLGQKPLQIFHTIILDKKHTGLQTMGAETIVELYLNIPSTVDEESAKPSTSKDSSSAATQSVSTSKDATNEPSTSNNFQSSKKSSQSPLQTSSQFMSSPVQSTSAQAMSRIEMHQHAIETTTKLEAVIKQESMNATEPVVTTEDVWKNGNQNMSNTCTMPAKIKTEPASFASPTVTVPKLTICDQNKMNLISVASASNPIANRPALNTQSPIIKQDAKQTFVKCIGKDGKVTLMRLIRDEKDPKIFKMILPPTIQSNKVVAQQVQGNVKSSAPIVINPNTIRPVVSTSTVSQGLVSNMQIGKIVQMGQIGQIKQPNSQSNALTSLPQLNAVNAQFKIGTKLISPVASPAIRVPDLTVNVQNTAANNQIRRISSGNLVSPLQNPSNQLLKVTNQMQMPKLVAINSPLPSTSAVNRPIPHSFAVSAPTKGSPLIAKANLSLLTPQTKVIQPNKKVFILDSNQMPKNQQQSLLRPQISLLKPRMPNNLTKITVSNISGLGNKNINVFVPVGIKLEAKKTRPSAQDANRIRHQYGDELEQRFVARTFANLTEAMGWLLKEMPLISPLAAQSEFREIFPFVVPSDADFHRMLVVKQRNFEWLRAKYINRLVTKHNALKSFTKWSTRDIVLFGRWFGYTPKSVLNLKESNVKKEIEPDVCDDAESQLAIENCPTDTISLNEKLTKWLDEVEEKSSKSFIKTINDEPFIVVDEDDDESSNRKASPLKNNRNCVQLPIESGHKEIMWINEVCRRTQIRFEEEEIDDGVVHRSAELVFVTALRSFVEDFLRKCSGHKMRGTNSESSREISTEITNDDIIQTISTIQQYDFLTNKNLGTSKPHKNDH